MNKDIALSASCPWDEKVIIKKTAKKNKKRPITRTTIPRMLSYMFTPPFLHERTCGRMLC